MNAVHPEGNTALEMTQRRLQNALDEIHKLWGAVPKFCDICDDLIDADAEICSNGHSQL